MDVESVGDASTSFDDLALDDVLQPASSNYNQQFPPSDSPLQQQQQQPMSASNLMQRLAAGDGNDGGWGMAPSPLATQNQPQQQQQQQADFQAYVARHAPAGFNFDQFQSHSSHSLPTSFRSHSHQQPLVMRGGMNHQNQQQQQTQQQQTTPQRPIQQPFHQRSRSHHLSSTQNFNHNPLPNR